MARLAKSTAQLTAATGTFTPGTSRYAFGLNAASGGFIYAPSALYFASSPSGPAEGPFLAPADPMGVAAQYRCEQNFDPFGIKAIYEVEVPLPRPGVYALLALTRAPHGLISSSSEIAVAASFPIPAVGQRPPAIETNTLATVL